MCQSKKINIYINGIWTLKAPLKIYEYYYMTQYQTDWHLFEPV